MPDTRERPEVTLGRLLTERGLTLAVAESCTGGRLGDKVTDVPGSSAYFLGGVISYANEVKEEWLGVEHETSVQHGAVSEEVARQMARGARERFQTDVALSITGIAGPSGGTAEKPVGLTFIGMATPEGERSQRYIWKGNRTENKERSVDAALQLLIDYLEERG